MPLDYPGGNYHDLGRKSPTLHPVVRGGRVKWGDRGSERHPDVVCDDWVELYTQFSTQWDALCHIGSTFDADGDGVAETVYYNGYRGGEHVPEPAAGDAFAGAGALGIENMAATGVQGRGVMVDLFAAFGRERAIVGYDALMRVMESGGVTVEEGDMLCLYTGQADAILEMNRKPDRETLEDAFSHLDGRDERLLRWIDESGVVAIAADNFSVEAVPPSAAVAGRAYEGLHELCLFKLGIHLGELWHLGPLNAWLKDHGRTRFLLTAPPLRLPGAAGSPVTPVATV
jgi:kynurenine formamidase